MGSENDKPLFVFFLLVLALLLGLLLLGLLVFVFKLTQQLHLTLLCNPFAICLEYPLLKHACGEDREHPFTLLHLLLLGHDLNEKK